VASVFFGDRRGCSGTAGSGKARRRPNLQRKLVIVIVVAKLELELEQQWFVGQQLEWRRRFGGRPD
jgi:hypothetical protein